jgi:hypothetical protein
MNCTRCGWRQAALDRRQCGHCLDVRNASQRARRNPLEEEFKSIKQAGRAYLRTHKKRPRIIVEAPSFRVLVQEINMLEKFGRRP